MGIGTIATTTDFAMIGRLLADTALKHQVEPPCFRSPPRLPGVKRSVTRNRDGSVTIAVAVRERPVMAVLADMIDGVVLASGRRAAEIPELHDELWAAGQQWIQNDRDESGRHLRVAAA